MRLKRYAILGIAVVLIASLIMYAVLIRRSRSPADGSLGPGTEATPLPVREPLNRGVIFGLTNNVRSVNGLSDLSENTLLNSIAEIRARDMFEKQYFSHFSPTGEQASGVAQNVGYKYSIVAENIAMGYFLKNQEIIDGWMQSPGHRKNILSTDVKELGTAVIRGTMKGQDTWIAVQIFGLQLAELPQCKIPSQDLSNEIKMKRAEINDLNDKLKDFRRELDEERASIEEARKTQSSGIAQNRQQLGIRLEAYNERSAQYNARIVDLKARFHALQSMITEYNDMVQAYNTCRRGH